MAVVISGKELAQKRKELMTLEVEELKNKYNKVPHLVVILVGDDPGSVSYVTGKKKACDEIGLKNTTIVKNTDITESELINIINELNNDDVPSVPPFSRLSTTATGILPRLLFAAARTV